MSDPLREDIRTIRAHRKYGAPALAQNHVWTLGEAPNGAPTDDPALAAHRKAHARAARRGVRRLLTRATQAERNRLFLRAIRPEKLGPFYILTA